MRRRIALVPLESSGAPKKGEKGEIEIAHVPGARASSEGDVFVRSRQNVGTTPDCLSG